MGNTSGKVVDMEYVKHEYTNLMTRISILEENKKNLIKTKFKLLPQKFVFQIL